jgi:nucleolar pre-ribosomal-associated protein 2
VSLATTSNKIDDITQAELMKMVLRTESAQAARVLRFWLTGVHQILRTVSNSSSQSTNLSEYIGLSLALEMWDLRTVDAKDVTGASAEEFSTECLGPALVLLEHLKGLRSQESAQATRISIDRATTTLDKLLARHLLAPARAAFFADAVADSTGAGSKSRDAKVLASNLEPLRAKLLQAAQIEDSDEALPSELASLFNAVPHLLDLAIRASPSRTPKGRSMEKPWLQAVFATLAESAGCSLTAPPEYVTRSTAIAALDGALRVLQVHDVGISSELLRNLFWYHSGVKYPERQEKQVHWSLIASLIELDPSVFVVENKTHGKNAQEQHNDLAEFIFEKISSADFSGSSSADNGSDGAISKKHKSATDENNSHPEKKAILTRVVVPLMSAFVRNRNLLGFLRRWDDQLVKSYRHGNRKALQEQSDLIWEDRALNSALEEAFEQSLTQGQIATLVQEHGKRLAELGDAIETASKEDVKVKKLAAYKRAASSAVLIPAILQSIRSDRIVETLKSDFRSLLLTYTTWVQDDRFNLYTRINTSWITLCQLLAKLWPAELHASSELQRDLLHPLLKQAAKDTSGDSKNEKKRRVDSPTRAAAMVFLFDACDRLQTVPGSEEVVRTSVRKATDSLSSSRLEPAEHTKMVEHFCGDFVALSRHLEADACRHALLNVISMLSTFDNETGDLICDLLSSSIFALDSSSLHGAYSTALIEAFKQNDNDGIHHVVSRAILHVQPAALPRDKRETVLNRTAELLASERSDTIGLLSVMAHLQNVPNATAKLSTDAEVIFTIAEQLHHRKLETDTALQILRELVQKTLGHIIPNQSQANSKEYLIECAGKLLSITKAKEECSPARLSLLRATSSAQQQYTLLHIERYVELLKQSLGGEDITSLQGFLDAFNELSLDTLKEAKLFDRLQNWLRTWVKKSMDLDSYVETPGQSPAALVEYVTRLHALVTKFGLYPDMNWLIKLTLKVLQEPLSPGPKIVVYATLKEALRPLAFYEKLDLVPTLADVQEPLDRTASYRTLNDLIGTMDDKLESNAELKQKQFALLPRLCVLLAESPDNECFNALLDCIITILNEKPSLASQYSIECVFSVLVKLTSRSSPALSSQHASAIFSRLCETSRLVLLVHRGRLGGRFHLLLPLLQGLLFCLFVPNSSRSGALPFWLRAATATESVSLTPSNATQYTRLLSTLCNPPQSSITKAHQHHQSRKSKDLNDPVKAAREKASHFLYPLLASFCRFQLNGKLDQGVREKLMPGIWEVVGTASLHREGLDAMFAGLGRSERDVWKTIWEEWEGAFGRRKVVGHGE